ncbi:hypothetical protein F4779DRAFT_469919 [Xylariaceae sp. FL0662B]|nr:hypothetical protein F4779DRAFT_469919 [Xylariaceae sp. FL0662B]
MWLWLSIHLVTNIPPSTQGILPAEDIMQTQYCWSEAFSIKPPPTSLRRGLVGTIHDPLQQTHDKIHNIQQRAVPMSEIRS